MIGDRIRQARLAAGLTQDEVVERLASGGFTITKAALSKYEKGKSEPKQSVLILSGRVLGVKPSYFLTEPVLSVEWLAFRKQTSLGKGKQEQIKAFVEEVVEKQSRLEEVYSKAALDLSKADYGCCTRRCRGGFAAVAEEMEAR